MRYRVSLTSRAKADLRAIRIWLDEVAGGGAGAQRQDEILCAIRSLQEFPSRWPVDQAVSSQALAIRKVVYLEPFREHLIYFAIAADEVSILHVRHFARRRPRKGSLKDDAAN